MIIKTGFANICSEITEFLDYKIRKFMIDFFKCHYKRFSKFSTVGVINTIIDFSVFYILYEYFGFYYLFAHIFAFLIAVINSFIINAIWTFKALNFKQVIRQVSLFIIVSVFGLCISSLVIYIAQGYMNIYLAKILAAISALSWNYLGSFLFVFKKPS